MSRPGFAAVLVAVFLTGPVAAQEGAESGQVQLPLDQYNNLVNASRDPVDPLAPAPADYALGTSTMSVSVAADEPLATAEVQLQLRVEVLEDGWVTVPVLPLGTPVTTATVNGGNIQLFATESGLAWGAKKAGIYTMALGYRIDAASSVAGFTLAVPTPPGSAVNLSASLPGSGLDVAVIPSAGTRVRTTGATTRVTATTPPSAGIQISWRRPVADTHTVGRASYQGRAAGDAVTWTGEIAVEVFTDDTVTLDLLPRTTTLREVKVDGKPASIVVRGANFATMVKGQGKHTVVVAFEVPVDRSSGPPRVAVTVPPVPGVALRAHPPRQEGGLGDPGRQRREQGGGRPTRATVFVPMTSDRDLQLGRGRARGRPRRGPRQRRPLPPAPRRGGRARRPRHGALRHHPRRDQLHRPRGAARGPGQPHRLAVGRGGRLAHGRRRRGRRPRGHRLPRPQGQG